MTNVEQIKRIPLVKKLGTTGCINLLLGGIGIAASAYALASGGIAIGARRAFIAVCESADEENAQSAERLQNESSIE